MPRFAPAATNSPMVEALLAWFAGAARDLPWRSRGEVFVTPWAVLVSEIMLQQTPVNRVLPTFREWIARWPTPAALAAATPGDAVRAWGRLGYPRRAIRLHAAAAVIAAHHNGDVPSDLAALRALPGVGDYTAAAVAAFAFRQRHAVLDTNVRRVLARVISGTATHGRGSVSAAERRIALELLPDDAERAATVSAALMELGALVCQARAPSCTTCPLAVSCAWRRAGYPASELPARPAQTYVGTDRQARGAILAVLRSRTAAVERAELRSGWADAAQFDRALDGLVFDRLVEPVDGDLFQLPG
jgi:A/G-specific adenine glycosylase